MELPPGRLHSRGAVLPLLRLVVVVVLVVVLGPLSVSVAAAEQPPSFHVVPHQVAEQGKAAHTDLAAAASREGFLQHLFGTACYTRALADMAKDCRSMTEEERLRLAVRLSNCFMARSTGGTARVQRCTDSMSVRQCTEGMDDRAFMAYTQFHSNIHSICLFLQNEDFRRQTEDLINDLHRSTRDAHGTLRNISGGLAAQATQVEQLGGAMAQIEAQQASMRRAVQEGSEEMKRLGAAAAGLQHHVTQALGMQEDLRRQQEALSSGLRDLGALEEARAADAAARWGEAARRGEALEARQAKYEELQAGLAAASQGLLSHAAALDGSVGLLAEYQRRTAAAVGYVAGSTAAAQGLWFYGLSATAVLLATSGAGTVAALGHGPASGSAGAGSAPGSLAAGLAGLRGPLLALLGAVAVVEWLLATRVVAWLDALAEGRGLVGTLLSSALRAALWAARRSDDAPPVPSSPLHASPTSAQWPFSLGLLPPSGGFLPALPLACRTMLRSCVLAAGAALLVRRVLARRAMHLGLQDQIRQLEAHIQTLSAQCAAILHRQDILLSSAHLCPIPATATAITTTPPPQGLPRCYHGGTASDGRSEHTVLPTWEAPVGGQRHGIQLPFQGGDALPQQPQLLLDAPRSPAVAATAPADCRGPAATHHEPAALRGHRNGGGGSNGSGSADEGASPGRSGGGPALPFGGFGGWQQGDGRSWQAAAGPVPPPPVTVADEAGALSPSSPPAMGETGSPRPAGMRLNGTGGQEAVGGHGGRGTGSVEVAGLDEAAPVQRGSKRKAAQVAEDQGALQGDIGGPGGRGHAAKVAKA